MTISQLFGFACVFYPVTGPGTTEYQTKKDVVEGGQDPPGPDNTHGRQHSSLPLDAHGNTPPRIRASTSLKELVGKHAASRPSTCDRPASISDRSGATGNKTRLMLVGLDKQDMSKRSWNQEETTSACCTDDLPLLRRRSSLGRQ